MIKNIRIITKNYIKKMKKKVVNFDVITDKTIINESFPCEEFRPPRGLGPTTSSITGEVLYLVWKRSWVRVPVEAEIFHMENFH